MEPWFHKRSESPQLDKLQKLDLREWRLTKDQQHGQKTTVSPVTVADTVSIINMIDMADSVHFKEKIRKCILNTVQDTTIDIY